ALHASDNHGQPKVEAIQAFDRNSGAQSATAGAKGATGVKNQAGAAKAKGGAVQTANGNSAFGHKQGNAATRTTGSQNNAYGNAPNDVSADPATGCSAGQALRIRRQFSVSFADDPDI